MNSFGEGKWTVESFKSASSCSCYYIITFDEVCSLQDDTFTSKVIAALRNEFAGHAVVKK